MAYNRPDADSLVAAFASSDFTRDEASWNDAVKDDEGPDELAVPEPDEEGNYTTPILTRLREALEEYDAKDLTADEMLDLLDRAQEVVNNMLTVMQMCVEQGMDDPENPINQAIRAGFELHVSGVDKLKAYFHNHQPAVRETAMTEIQEATNRLVDAFAFFQRLRIAALTVLCPSCGAENRKGTPKCIECNAALPVVAEAQERSLLAVAAEGVLQAEGSVPIRTPNYERLEAAMSAWELQELDDDGLLAEIDAIEANMLAHQEANASEREDVDDLSDEEAAMVLKLCDAVEAALQANLAALRQMKLFFEEGDPDNLRNGFEAFGHATRQIIEAYMASQTLLQDSENEYAE